MKNTDSETETGDETPDEAAASSLADRVGSDEGIVWIKRITMGLALAFLVGALGYFIGVRTSAPPSNTVDVGFLRDMTDHHDQAVAMARNQRVEVKEYQTVLDRLNA